MTDENNETVPADDFEALWPHFVAGHQNPATRWAHVAALGAGVLGLRAALARRSLVPLALGGAVAGALAVFSHPLFEGNWPENLGRPLHGGRAFLRLCARTLTRSIHADLAALPKRKDQSPPHSDS